MCNFATPQEITSTNSSYWGDWDGESAVSSTISTSTSSEDDGRSIEPSFWVEEPVVSASNLWERALDQEGEEGERDWPVSIPSARSTCDLHKQSLGSSGTRAMGNAGEDSLLKESPLGSDHHWRDAHNADNQPPWRLTECASLPNKQRIDCEYPHPWWSEGRE